MRTPVLDVKPGDQIKMYRGLKKPEYWKTLHVLHVYEDGLVVIVKHWTGFNQWKYDVESGYFLWGMHRDGLAKVKGKDEE